MGQILNRAFKVAKSYLNDEPSTFNYSSLSEDEELKKIIDDLKKDKDKNNQKANQNKNENYNQNAQHSINSVNEAFKILQIHTTASIEEIKSAYKLKIKEYHPDRLETFGDELKILAQKKTQEINKAYNLIKEKKDF